MGLRCHNTQIIHRYVSQYILSDNHGRIYNVRDWDILQVPALAYDSLVWMKPVPICLYTGGTWIDGNNDKKTLVSL